MATRFRLYSTDVDATVAPSSLEVPPATLIVWDHDPILSGGLVVTPPEGRGQVIQTGANSCVIQDLGIPANDKGGTITVTGNVDDGEYLLPATISAMRTSEAVVGGQWYFTDGLRCWKVQWSRKPRGLNAWVHQLWLEHGREEYSYEVVFVIVERVI